MAQVTDRTVGANPTGFDMRTELNNIICALESDNSGSSEPLNTVAYMKWLDTSNATYYYYKERNHDNTAWVTLFRYTVATKIIEAVSNGVVLNDSNLVHKTGDTMSGNLNFASGTKITGDFSNTTVPNRTLLQTNITNGTTDVSAIPNGSSVVSSFQAYNSSEASNCSLGWFGCTNADARIQSAISGTGTYLPMTFYTGGSERMRIDTSGNVLVTGSGGLGYGTGSGGTVTQLTSKSTAVTLNKPCGQITMNNASLAAGGYVAFDVYNSLVTTNDTCVLSIKGGSSAAPYAYIIHTTATNGGIYITIQNILAGALAEALVINFAILKGATA